MKSNVVLALLLIMQQTVLSQPPTKAEVVTLNGNPVYYEVYGEGEPLLLLHGYTLSMKSWKPFVNTYAKNYKVYLVDLQGHGKSGPFTKDLSIKSVARDVDELIKYLNLKSINAVGFSYGGDVLFQLAVAHPGVVKSMIAIGGCGIWRAKQFPDWLEELSYKNMANLKYMYDHQESEEQIRIILDQLVNYDCSMTDEEIRSIKTTTLLVLGDRDSSVPLEYISRVRKNLPHSYLWILPNTDHGAHYGKNKDEFLRVSHLFFQGQWGQR